MKDTVIFDLDGTLLDTLDDLKDSVNFALDKQGFPLRTRNEIRSFVGNGIKLLMERSVPENTPQDICDICFKDFCDYYKIHMEDKTAPYDGIIPMLENLKTVGFKSAVVTNKADFAAQNLCRRIFGNNIDVTVGSADGRRNKPAPDGVYYAMEMLKTTAEKSIFVGDSDVDIQTAKNAGIDSIGVLWGFRDEDVIKKSGAKMIVNSVFDLEKLLISAKND